MHTTCCRFAALYEEMVPPTLFERLQFIMCQQEWAPLSDTFWLNHALVSFLKSKLHSSAARHCSVQQVQWLRDVMLTCMVKALHPVSAPAPAPAAQGGKLACVWHLLLAELTQGLPAAAAMAVNLASLQSNPISCKLQPA